MITEAAAESSAITRLVFFRVEWKISIQFATSVSRMDTEEVRAANTTIRKNIIPRIPPRGPMVSNTLGRDTNIRLGPEAIPSVPKNT